MTKKRFRLSVAALGVLAAFLMALIALLLAPTLASADKDSGTPHQHTREHGSGSSDAGSGGAPHDAIYADNGNWHEPDHGYGHAFDGPTCPDGAAVCTDPGEIPGTQYFGGDGSSGSSGDGDSHGGQGNGLPNGFGFTAGGFPGGSFGGAGTGEGGNNGKSGPDDGNPGSGDPDNAPTGPEGPNVPPVNLDIPNDPPLDTDPPPFDGGSPSGPNPDGPPGFAPLNLPTTPVPEPLTLSLFAVGLAGSVAMRRRHKGK